MTDAPTLALVGPTATGKSSLALALAEHFGCEIVSLDSMTIYRGMDVGTAKPSMADRARVPYHLLDVAEPSERFSVAEFQRLARAAIADIRARARRPLIVGGSGLYFRAAVDDLSFPPFDAAVRERLEREDGVTLALRLKQLDPVAAAFVDPANKRRVVRALEVIEITGRPFSSFRGSWEHRSPLVAAGLRIDGALLDARIRARLRQQVADGLFEEVRGLLDRGYRESITAGQAIPYGEAIRFLDGELTEDGFHEQAARANKRLARRQMSWFRRDPRIRWFDAEDPERALEEVAAYYSERSDGE